MNNIQPSETEWMEEETTMTPNQREDMDRELELEERWHPLNVRRHDSLEVFYARASWIVGVLAGLCALARVGYAVLLIIRR